MYKNIILFCVMISLFSLPVVYSVVVGIDLGSQWYKVALVKPGSFDIVLNEQSSRKTHTIVGWNRGERFFGTDAYNLLQRNPSQVYSFVTQLLGKKYDHPITQINKDWITYSLVEDTDRGTIGVAHDEEITFSPEELTAMILRHAKDIVSNAAGGSPVKDCVITVPPWLTHHERQAIIDAAELAGFNVLSLINDITAFALNYAKDRKFDNNTHNVIFYDIGATGTKVLLATLQSVADVKAKKNKTIAQVLVRATAWDQTLGGRFLDQQLANHFKQMIKKKYPDVDTSNIRLTLRLLKEAAKAKEVLSANQQTQAVFQGLGDHEDMVVTITRKEFEEIGKEFWARAMTPISRVLEEANMTKEEVTYVEIVGGSTRIPKIQYALKEFLGRDELDKHVNGDEGAAIGAAFFAAGLSSQFHVKEVRVRDLTSYPINVRINLSQDVITPITTESEDGEEGEEKVDTDTGLFLYHSRINTRKGLTFYTFSNFTLDLTYDQSDPKYKLPEGSVTGIMHINVSEMPSVQKYNMTGKPKVHASFLLSSSSVISLAHIEAEITTLQYAAKAKENTTIPANPANETEAAGETTTPTGDESTTDESTNSSGNEQKEANENVEQDNLATEESDKTEEATEPKGKDSTETQTFEEDNEGELELVKRVHIISLKTEVTPLGVQSVDYNTRTKYEKRMTYFDDLDKKRKELQQERNALESYLYDTRDKLETSSVIEASTEEEREAINADLSSASDWLAEHEDDATIHEYKIKLRHLKDKTERIYFRVKEKVALPSAIEELQSTLNLSTTVLRNITDFLNVTEEEKERVEKIITTTEEWLATKITEQAVIPLYQDPVLTSNDVSRKKSELDMHLKFLIRRPKKKPPVVEKKFEDDDEDEAENTGAERDADIKTEAGVGQEEEKEKEKENGHNEEKEQTDEKEQNQEKKEKKEKEQQKKEKERKGRKKVEYEKRERERDKRKTEKKDTKKDQKNKEPEKKNLDKEEL